MKLSAPYRLGADGTRLASHLYPRLRGAFGLERLMWGSDWPHTQFESTQKYEDEHRSLATLIGNDAETGAILGSPGSLFGFC